MGFSVGLDLGALAGGVTNAGGGILQGYWNKKQQEKNLEYQKDLQARIFEREDDSVQRRVADLKKAGLSPTLAAGSGAGAGSVISTQAPQMSGLENLGKSIETALVVKNLESMNQDISKKIEENVLIRKQQHKTDVDALKSEAERRNIDIQSAIKGLDYQIQKETGMSSDPSQVGKTARDIVSPFLKLYNQGLMNYHKFNKAPTVEDYHVEYQKGPFGNTYKKVVPNKYLYDGTKK